MDVSNILSALDRIQSLEKPIVVFGDYCLDKYLFIDPLRDEPSLETGITAYQVFDVKCYPGAAGTVCSNLCALGASVCCVGFCGDDGDGLDLLNALNRIGADTSLMVKTGDLRTCTYIKPMRGQSGGSYIELNRLDIRNFCTMSRELEEKLISNLRKAVKSASAVIILDQFMQRNMGTLTDYVRENINAIAQEANGKGVLFYADSRAFANEYRNMIVKCNNMEFMALKSPGTGDPEDENSIRNQAVQLIKSTGNSYFITRGSLGMMVTEGDDVKSVQGFRVDGPIDIVGAGDASSAGIVLGLVLGLNREEAARLACAVSSITIQQIGCTGTATLGQVRDRLTGRG